MKRKTEDEDSSSSSVDDTTGLIAGKDSQQALDGA